MSTTRPIHSKTNRFALAGAEAKAHQCIESESEKLTRSTFDQLCEHDYRWFQYGFLVGLRTAAAHGLASISGDMDDAQTRAAAAAFDAFQEACEKYIVDPEFRNALFGDSPAREVQPDAVTADAINVQETISLFEGRLHNACEGVGKMRERFLARRECILRPDLEKRVCDSFNLLCSKISEDKRIRASQRELAASFGVHE